MLLGDSWDDIHDINKREIYKMCMLQRTLEFLGLILHLARISVTVVLVYSSVFSNDALKSLIPTMSWPSLSLVLVFGTNR